jgi:hypothetical protein
VEIARLPEQIKGYGHVKERNLAAARGRWAGLMATRWGGQAARGGLNNPRPVAGLLSLPREVLGPGLQLQGSSPTGHHRVPVCLQAFVCPTDHYVGATVFISSAFAQTAPAAAAAATCSLPS